MADSVVAVLMRRNVSVMAVLLAGCLLAAGVYFTVDSWERRTLELEFSVESEVVFVDILAAYRRSLVLLESMHGLFVAGTEVSRDGFSRFTKPLQSYFPGVQAMEWIPRVPAGKRKQFERRLDAYGGGSAFFKEKGESGELVPAGDRKDHFPVFYVEPLKGNEAVLGFDLGSNPVRRNALRKAADSGKIVASGRISLIQGQGVQHGFLLFHPVYREGEPGETSFDAIRGFLLLVYRLADFIKAALSDLKATGVAAYILDKSAPAGERFLYGWRCREENFGQLTQGMSASFVMDVGQREWEVVCVPLPSFYERFQTRYSVAATAGALLLTVLVAVYAAANAGRTERIREQVRERTAELRDYVRQLNCLYAISSLVEQSGKEVDEVLRQIVTMIPMAFDHPLDMRVSISNEGRIYGHPAGEGAVGIAVEDINAPEKVGELHIARGQSEVMGADGFSETELALIKSVAAQIAAYIERKRAERQLVDARDEAQQATRAKSEFLANMSHEVRTPLNAIIGLSEMVRKTGLTPKQLDYFSKIQGASRSLLGIVNDILDFSRIEAGKLVFEQMEMRLAEVLWRLLELYGPRADNKGIQFNVITETGLLPCMVGDSLRFEQVLTNLTTNAIKFTDHGQVDLMVSPVGVDSEKVRIRVQVRDTGIGIGTDDREMLFESFTQADGSHTRQHGGTGLGLAITRQLVHLMNGEILVESALGKGSSFTAEVEFGTPDEERPLEARELLTGKRALVVGPATMEAERVAGGLEELGFDVICRDEGEAALELATDVESEKLVDLVWTDWKTPGMNGLELARALNNRLPIARLPRLILGTGHLTGEVRRLAESLFDKVVLQPVCSQSLAEVVDRLFGLAPLGMGDSDGDARAAVRGARLLVAEDNGINRQVIQEILEDAGVHVAMAVNGREVVEMARFADKDVYDGALMDIQMPQMDGLEATRAIREFLSAEEFPIIAMTAHAMTEDRERCFEAGMNDYVSKPLDVNELFRVLSYWMEGRGSGESTAPELRSDTGQPIIPALDGFDVQAGLERLGGKNAVYKRLLLEFQRDYAHVVEDLRQLLDADDWEHAKRHVHTVKGVSGNIGATDVHDAAVELERSLKAGIPCSDCLEVFSGAMRVALSSLERYRIQVESGDEPDTCSSQLGAAAFAEKLDELRSLLDASDFKAVRIYEEVREVLACSEAAGEASLLEESINSFDFRNAGDNLRTILMKLGIS